MKASEFLKRYEEQQKAAQSERDEEPEDHSLQAQAKERARHPERINAGTPFDWEDLESYQKELERLEREGPGKGRSGSKD